MASSAGGGGPGSNAIPPISQATQFQNQFQGPADASAFSGMQQIANNAFYPMPQVSSFLFPQGVPGLIAPMYGGASPPPPPSGGGGGGGAPAASAGTGAGESTMAAGMGPFGGTSAYYGAPATAAQLAQQMFASVQAGGQYGSQPGTGGLQDTLNPQQMMQLQSIASGSLSNPYITQAQASQFLQGNYPVADQLAPEMSAIDQAVTQQAAQGALQGPVSVTPGAGYGPPAGTGGDQVGGTQQQGGMVQGNPYIGSEMDPMLAGYLGGVPGATSALLAGSPWGSMLSSMGYSPSSITNMLGGGTGTPGMIGGSDPLAYGVGAGGAGTGAQPGGGVSGLSGGFGPYSVGAGNVGPGQANLVQNPWGQQSEAGAAFTTSPESGTVTSPYQVATGGYQGLNTNNPLASNFVSPGTQGTGQGALGSGQSFSYPGAAAFLGMGPQISASGMDVPPVLQGAAGAILNAGFDPEGALRAQTANQTAQATNANLAASGLATTPYGNAVLGNTMGNFGLNWNDRQLARMAQAGTSAAGLSGEAQTLQQQALNALQGGAVGAYQQPQQSIQDFLSYLGQATSQNQVNVNAYAAMANAANQAQQNAQQASQAGKSGITGGLGSAGSALAALIP